MEETKAAVVYIDDDLKSKISEESLNELKFQFSVEI
jgi:hypothetical protein